MSKFGIETNLEWEIIESPVLFEIAGKGIKKTDEHKVISRDDNDKVLSVMKKSYVPMSNKHFVDTTVKMAEISGFDIAGYSEFSGGKIVFSHLKNTESNLIIAGHKIDDYLLLGHSHDGRFPFFIGTTTYFIRCENQYSAISRAQRIRHTKSAPVKVELLLKSLEGYFKSRDKIYKDFNNMVNFKIDELIINEGVDFILDIKIEDRLNSKISTRKINQSLVIKECIKRETNELGMNMFGFLNGVTYFVTHKFDEKEKTFGNIFGTGSILNKRAYDYAVSKILNL